jgi:hypothetical protein
MSPVMQVNPVVGTPALVRRAKSSARPRFTRNWYSGDVPEEALARVQACKQATRHTHRLSYVT